MVTNGFEKCQESRFSHRTKQQLVGSLSNAATNFKHPKGPHLAFEFSKCFAIGFGLSRDLQPMESWLSVATDRGHELAKILTESLRSSRGQVKKHQEPSVQKLDPLFSLLEMRRKQLKTDCENVEMDHIDDFETYAAGDTRAIKALIKNRLSEGLSIDHITGYASLFIKINWDEVKLSLLHWAARCGRIELLQVLLEFGANVNSSDPFRNRSTLEHALMAGQSKVAELLLQTGAHFGERETRFLYLVSSTNFSEMIDLVKKAPKPPPFEYNQAKLSYNHDPWDYNAYEIVRTPLIPAAKYGHIQAVEAYLYRFTYLYTSEDLFQAYSIAVQNLQAPLCDLILRSSFRFWSTLPNPFDSIVLGTVYDWILFHGQQWAQALDSTIEVLLSHGFDTNESTNTAPVICRAVHFYAHEPAVASALLAHGASLEQRSKKGYTVLDHAIFGVRESKNIGCVRWLLDQGIPLMSAGSRYDPLHLACIVNAYGAARALLEHGELEISKPSKLGTPLHIACSRNAVQMVQLLLEYGAETIAVDENEETPLENAIKEASVEVIRHFLNNNLSIYNTHSTPPRSILAFCVKSPRTIRTSLMQLLLAHPRLRSAEILCEIDASGRSTLAYAIEWLNDDLALDLLHAGAEIGHPSGLDSTWAILLRRVTHFRRYCLDDPRVMRRYHLLLQAFVDRFKKNDLIEVRDDHGQTLLSRAANGASVAALKFLLDAGALVHTVDCRDLSPLHYALFGLVTSPILGRPGNGRGRYEPTATREMLEMLSLLLDTGANPNAIARGYWGMTSLYFAALAACRLRSAAGVELLCARGARVDMLAIPMAGARPLHVVLEAPAFAWTWGLCPELSRWTDLANDQDVEGWDANTYRRSGDWCEHFVRRPA